jgi:uncharacterized oligopeptide transporter (OPT) family protein
MGENMNGVFFWKLTKLLIKHFMVMSLFGAIIGLIFSFPLAEALQLPWTRAFAIGMCAAMFLALIDKEFDAELGKKRDKIKAEYGDKDETI